MFHLDNNSGVSSMPAVGAMQDNTTRWFTEGAGNQSPSWPGQDWFNIVQAELLNVLAEGGVSPVKTQLNQLAAAIKSIVNKNALMRDNLLSEIKGLGAPAQATARGNLGLGTAATVDVQSSTTDTTTGRVMRVGAGGLLSTAPRVVASSSGDLSKLPAITRCGFSEYTTSDGSVYIAGVGAMTITTGNYAEWLCPENGTSGRLIAVRNKDAIFFLYSDKNKPTSDDVGALPVAMRGSIVNNGKMSSANKPGWYSVSVANTSTVSDFPAYPTGSKVYGYGMMFVEIAGSCCIQHYYSHHGVNAKRQTWTMGGIGAEPWVIEYNTANKPTAADVGAYSKSESDNRFQAKGSYIQDIQFGAGTKVTTYNQAGTWPGRAGYTVTSVYKDMMDYNIDGIVYAPLQKKVNNTWYTVSGGTA